MPVAVRPHVTPDAPKIWATATPDSQGNPTTPCSSVAGAWSVATGRAGRSTQRRAGRSARPWLDAAHIQERNGDRLTHAVMWPRGSYRCLCRVPSDSARGRNRQRSGALRSTPTRMMAVVHPHIMPDAPEIKAAANPDSRGKPAKSCSLAAGARCVVPGRSGRSTRQRAGRSAWSRAGRSTQQRV